MTLCEPMDCSPPGSSVHGISQARILEWVAISFSRASFRPRGWTRISYVYLHWQVGSWTLALPISLVNCMSVISCRFPLPTSPLPLPKGKKTLFPCDENFRIYSLSIFPIYHIAVLTMMYIVTMMHITSPILIYSWKFAVPFDCHHPISPSLIWGDGCSLNLMW